MTLSKFKNLIKISFVFLFFLTYSVGIYSLGKSNAVRKLQNVKGVTTQISNDDPIEKPLPYTDIQSSKVIPSYVKLCANSIYGFELAYPKDWFTTYNTDEQRCIFFAPYSFIVPQVADDDITPIRIELFDIDKWQLQVKLYENPNDFQNVISSKNVEINGKTVKEIEAISTGKGNTQRGFKILHYLVFDSKNPLRVTYKQFQADEDVNKNSQITRDIVNSLRYF